MGLVSGLLLGFVLGIAIIAVFVHLQKRRAIERQRLAFFIAGLSRMKKRDLRRIFPNSLYPQHIVFSAKHKANWLNQELDRVWPFVAQQIFGSAMPTFLCGSLETILEQYKPATLVSLKFQQFNLGNIAPQITGIEIIKESTDEPSITMEIMLQWNGNPSIILAVQTLAGLSLPLEVKDVIFSGILRLIFKPLVERSPCFGALSYSLREVPKFDFTIKDVGGEVASLLGLSGVVERLIKTAVIDSLVWPMRKIIPIFEGDYSDLELQITGILQVKIIQAKNVLNKDVFGKSDPFAYLYIRPLPSHMKKSKTIKNDLNPIWNEHFQFEVEDPQTQRLVIKICDEDDLNSKEVLGFSQIELKKLQPGKITELWLPLIKELDKPYLEKNGQYRGEVHLELTYRSIDEDSSEIDIPLRTYSQQLTSLEQLISKETSSMRRSFSSLSHKEENIIRGILSVHVAKGENLKPFSKDKKSNPFVIVKMKKSQVEKRTKVIEDSINPEWNQTFYLMVEDALHDILIVEVWDHKIFNRRSMGTSVLTLTKLLRDGEYKAEIQLDGVKNGKIFLNLKWIQPVHPDPRFL